MPQPPAYNRQYDFSDFQASFPSQPLPGNQVDIELDAVKSFIDQMRTNIALIQKDDGTLKNQTVGLDQAKSDLIAYIANSLTIEGDWATSTAYVVGSLVEGPDGATYIATTAHTSGTFTTDRDTNNYWTLFANPVRYLGTPLQDVFDGDNSTTAFTLSQEITNETQIIVFVGGSFQSYDTFSVSGTTLTFASAPPTGTGNIVVIGADTAVSQAAMDAAASEAAAATSETNAATSETNAATSAATATTQAGIATTQAGIATTQATAAAASANDAAAALASAPWRDVVFITNADSPYTLDATHNGKFISVDTSGGAVTINLPGISASTLPYNVTVKKTSSDGNAITVDANGTDEIGPTDAATDTIATVGGTTYIADVDKTPDHWTTSPFGAAAGNMTVDEFVAPTDFTAGSTTQLTLSVDPGSENNTWVYFNGLQQAHSAYSVSGTTLTFTSAIPTGTTRVDVIIGTTLAIGVPGDGTGTTEKHADNSVTLDKMEHGTQGDVLYYGASGEPLRLGAGTLGQVLQSGGAGANPSWVDAAGGAWSIKASGSISAQSSFDFTDLSKNTVIFLSNLTVTSSQRLKLRASTNNGSSFVATSYDNAATHLSRADSSIQLDNGSSHNAVYLSEALTTTASFANYFIIKLFDMTNTSNVKHILHEQGYMDGSGLTSFGSGTGVPTSLTAAIDAVRIMVDSGTISCDYVIAELN